MKDINFFSTYIEKKRLKINSKIFLPGMFLVFFIYILGQGLINQLKINKISQEIFEIQRIAEDPKTSKEAEKIEIQKKELNKLRAEVEDLRELTTAIEKKDFINTKYIDDIIRKKPKDLFLTGLQITSEDVNITGISNNKLSIAEFLKGLQSINRFEDAFVSLISKEEINYKFQLENIFSKQEKDTELVDINEQEDLENEWKE